MDVLLPTLSLIIGAVLFTISFRMVSQANTSERIPQLWGRPARHPRRIHAVRAAAIGLLLLGVAGWSSTLGYAGLLLLLPAFLPVMIMNVLHNRRVARGQHGQRGHPAAQPAAADSPLGPGQR